MPNEDFFPWLYKYDRKGQVWRAFHAKIPTLEINQYHKEELLFVMGKFGDSVEWGSIKKQQVASLDPDEKRVFLTS